MADTDNPPEVDEVLSALKSRQEDFACHVRVANDLSVYLKTALKDSPPFLRSADVQVVGSQAEGLATTHEDDTDLILTLGPPYTTQYFKVNNDGSGQYQLHWNQNLWDGQVPRFVTKKGVLDVMALRNETHKTIASLLEKKSIVSGVRVTKVMEWKQCVRVMLFDHTTNAKHTVDVILQIRGDLWSRTDGLLPINTLAPELQEVISSLEASGQAAVHFGLHGPSGTDHTTLTTSHAILEKHFFNLPDVGKVRDAVLLTKLVLTGQNWKKRFGLKGVHIKRIAMKNCTTLKALPAWSGVYELLRALVAQLHEGHVDGYPDLDTDLYWAKTAKQCQTVARVVQDTLITLVPQFFSYYL